MYGPGLPAPGWTPKSFSEFLAVNVLGSDSKESKRVGSAVDAKVGEIKLVTREGEWELDSKIAMDLHKMVQAGVHAFILIPLLQKWGVDKEDAVEMIAAYQQQHAVVPAVSAGP